MTAIGTLDAFARNPQWYLRQWEERPPGVSRGPFAFLFCAAVAFAAFRRGSYFVAAAAVVVGVLSTRVSRQGGKELSEEKKQEIRNFFNASVQLLREMYERKAAHVASEVNGRRVGSVEEVKALIVEACSSYDAGGPEDYSKAKDAAKLLESFDEGTISSDVFADAQRGVVRLQKVAKLFLHGADVWDSQGTYVHHGRHKVNGTASATALLPENVEGWLR